MRDKMGLKHGAREQAGGQGGRVRLFVDAPIMAGDEVPLPSAQRHYLGHVVRLAPGDTLFIFNGRDGEWRATIAKISRDACALVPQR